MGRVRDHPLQTQGWTHGLSKRKDWSKHFREEADLLVDQCERGGDTGNTQRGFMISQGELEKKRGPECPVSEMLYHTNWCLFPNAGRTDVDIKHQFFSVIHLITFRTYDVTGKRDEVCKFQVCRHSNGSKVEMTLSKPRKSHWKEGDRCCGSAGRLLSSTCEVSSPIQHCIPTERGIIRGVGGWCLNF